jgi:pyruvate dehydrogenase E2 component (dihydrolipoamide acetyltransferase)
MPYVSMPKLSDTMTEGTLIKWVAENGAQVEPGDIIAEVETDKATMEMEAFDEGILTTYATEGDKVPVGSNIAFVAGEGEETPASPDSGQAPAPPSEPAPEPAPEDRSEDRSPEEAGSTPAPPSTNAAPAGATPKSSPLAAKLAVANHLDLSQIQGSGPGGRIIKRDILAALDGSAPFPAATQSGPTGLTPAQASAPAQALATSVTTTPIIPASATPKTQAPSPATPAPAGATKIPLSGMRTIIAERLLESKSTIPHFYLNLEIDAAPLLALRKQINHAASAATPKDESPFKYTLNDFILKATVAAVAAVPQVNASFAGDHILQYDSIGLSVAIAVEDGLVTPDIPAAETKSLQEISLAVKDLAARARNKRLSPNEFQGGTLTVSNLGAYGIDNFDAIINPPQAIILSIGAIKQKPVVVESEENASGSGGPLIVAGQRMWIGLSCDHRVVDGAVGATYLNELKKLLENPALMLV